MLTGKVLVLSFRYWYKNIEVILYFKESNIFRNLNDEQDTFKFSLFRI